MPSPDVELVAVQLPPIEAAGEYHRIWDAGDAVLPLGPAAPASEVDDLVSLLRPTRLVDAGGSRDLDDGIPADEGTVAVVPTSGTTGRPKGVVLTHDGLAASTTAVFGALDVDEDDRWLCCLPTHHVAGLGVLGRAWLRDAPLVVHPAFDTDAVAGVAERRRASLVLLVPTMLRRLLDAGVDLTAFRQVLVGGGPLPPALGGAARAAGVAVTTTYGLSETWGGVAYDGRALEGVELALGEQDEILVRGGMVMGGYRFQPELTAEVITPDDWLRTGDVGRFADGRLEVIERLSEVVITGGVNVSPTEVEHVLIEHPSVADVCVAGAPDAEWGERVTAYVVPASASAPPSLDDLRSFARDRLSAAKLPREVVLVEEIPRTAAGKAVRRALAP